MKQIISYDKLISEDLTQRHGVHRGHKGIQEESKINYSFFLFVFSVFLCASVRNIWSKAFDVTDY